MFKWCRIPSWFWLIIALVDGQAHPLNAQSITAEPDSTGTMVTIDGEQYNISGGSLSEDGRNLFHSFDDFGLDANQVANFLSNPQIQNILGRVVGGEASIINGLIQVTGGHSNLYLMNPSGLIFGENASLNVPGSFTATTANGIGFENGWFNGVGKNTYKVLIGSPNQFALTMNQPGSLVNLGDLAVTEGQNLTLLGGTVVNNGSLEAPGGNIIVTAVPGENLVRISQPGMVLSLEIAATGEGDLPTDAGISPLSLAELLTGDQVASEGVTVDAQNQVRLAGSDVVIPQEAGTTISGGEIDVSDSQQGGNVYLLGEQVGVIDARINANGGNSGGNVLIGGGYQGQGTVPNALRTFVSGDAVIQADALNLGDGGQVIAWADKINRFWGNVSATGGENGGNGGFVEISGKDSLIFRGGVDVGAPSGNLGQILFDPKNITISDGGGDNLAGNDGFSENPTGDVTFDADQINSLTGNVTLQANNDITVSENITVNSGNSLTLQAGKSITVNNVIELSGGNFSATINDENAVSNRDAGEAVFSMNSGSEIRTDGGNITIAPGTFGGNQIGKVYLDGATLNAGEGNIEITGKAGSGIGIELDNGAVVQSTGDGKITFTGTGGAGTDQNQGIRIENNSKVSATNGEIQLAGIGGENATGQFNHGISLTEGGVVESTGDGKITFTGTGGAGTGNNRGIEIRGTDSKVSATNGEIQLTGTGGENSTGVTNNGILLIEGGVVESTGDGKITFTGTGGAGTAGRGIAINGTDSKVSATNGEIQLTGTGGANTTGLTNNGILLLNGGVVESTGTGNITMTGTGGNNEPGISLEDNSVIQQTGTGSGTITLNADEISLNDTSTIQGTGILNLQPLDPSLDIAIGSADNNDTSSFDLTNEELSKLQGSFTNLTIGRSDSTGTVTLKDGVTFNTPVNIVGGSTLVGANQDITWNITETNQGNLNDTFANGLTFSNIENVTGGTGNDTFIFSDGATLTGTINNSGGINIIDHSNTSTSLSVNITGIDQFTINNTTTVNQVSNLMGSSGDDTILFSNGASLSGNLDGGAGNLTLKGDEIDVTGTISGSGNLLIEPETASQSIQIGGSNSTTSLDLTATKLSQIQPGFSAITIGRTDGSGVITLGGNTEFNRPVTLQSLGEGGTIDTSGGTLANPNGNITLDANQNITTANIAAPGQQISLTSKNGSIDTSVGILNSSNVTLNANQNITTADITASDVINLTSNDGEINTSAGTLNGSSITLNTNQDITTATITASDVINLTSDNGIINTSAGTLNGSSITLNTNQDITTATITASDVINLTSDNGIINTSAGTLDGSSVALNANQAVTTADITASGQPINLTSENGSIDTSVGILNGSTITLNANQNITTADITASDSINLTSDDGEINTSAATLNGSNITLNANQNITTANITASDSINLTSENGNINTSAGTLDTSSTTGNGGNLTLRSPNGTVTTSNLNTNGATDGGDIFIEAQTQITTGAINSQGETGKGGDVTLDPEGDIQVSSINAQGGTTGGDVDITTNSFFRATDSFSAANGTAASISTMGGTEGGDIIIRHGGFLNNTPFDIGNGTTNGTAAAITSGEFTLAPPQSFPFTHTEGNIRIITGLNSLSPDIIQSLSGNTNDNLSNGTLADSFKAGDISASALSIVDDVNATNSTTGYIESLEQQRLQEFADYFGQDFSQYSISLSSIEDTLKRIQQQTGNRSAIIYGVTQPDQLTLVVFTADVEPVSINVAVSQEELQQATQQLRVQLTDSFRRQGKGYLKPAQNLYNWLIAPIAKELANANIDTLLFSLDGGLRTIPLAALHDGESFLIETYSLSLIPTFSLMNSDYQPIPEAKILAMGASEFEELNPLPAVPVELSTITQQLGAGEVFLNQEFTKQNLIQQRQNYPYQIIHLGTHGDFQDGGASNSYVQLWDDKLNLTEMRQLGWDNPPVELLVLSACRTAIGSKDAELGFAGLAVASGVKSALGSIWQVDDAGTLALMSEFYTHLGETAIKAEALRQAQLSMLRKEVVIEGGQLRGVGLSNPLVLPPELAERLSNVDLSNPYYWSAFTLIGSPW